MGIKRTVSIRQIDLWGSEPLESKKIKQNWQKTEMSIFPLYFWANPFVILKVVAALQKNLKTLENYSELVLGIDTAVCEIP